MSSNLAKMRFIGSDVAGNRIPVDFLVRALQGMQQTALFLAASVVEKKAVQKRFRPSEELRRRCTLRCGPLSGGSVEVAISFEDKGEHLFPEAPYEGLMDRLLKFTSAVSKADEEALGSIIPDSRFRVRALRETLNYLPGAGQRWSLELANGSATPIKLDVHTRAAIEQWFKAAGSETMVITGHLTKIDFEANRVVVRYPPTNKLITCDYEVDTEDALIQSRRHLVQVHGKFDLDNNGCPKKAIDVTRIEPLDLSPMVFDDLHIGDEVLHIGPPLVIKPFLEKESLQLLIAEDEEIGLHAYASTREDLEKEVVTQLLILWKEYGLENTSNLTPAALRLQTTLKSRFVESGDAKT